MRYTLPAAMLMLASCAVQEGPGKTDDSDTTVPSTWIAPLDIEWSSEMIEEHDGGLQSQLALAPSGNVYVAHWSNAGFEDGLCEEVLINTPPRQRYDLFLAEHSGGAWSTETIEQPTVAFTPNGIGIAVDAAGEPAVAFTGGPASDIYCGGNDAVLAERSGGVWSFDTAAAESADAFAGEAASDFGTVVGIWPGLAYDANGQPAIVYRDAHSGTIQHDDLYRADFEFAWRDGGGWLNEPADIGEGAGDFGKIVFDGKGRPVAAYAITVISQSDSRHGVWATRRESDGTWERVLLHTGAIDDNITGGVDPITGDIVFAFYSKADSAVRVWRLVDADRFTEIDAWEGQTVGQAQYDEGQYVSLAFTPAGEVALAYHRCRLISAGGSACDMNDEAVIFAVEQDAGWAFDVVHEAETGSCGEYTSLAIDQATSTAWISFRCTDGEPGNFAFRPYVASGVL